MALTRRALHGLARHRALRVLSSFSLGLALVTGMLVNPPVRVHAGSGYSNAVIADGPTFYYGLDETSGTTATDSSVNGLNGTYIGSPALGVSGATGPSDTAISLPAGGSSYVNSNDVLSSAPAPSTFTLEAWVDIPGAITTPSTIIGYSSPPSTKQGFNWYLNADDTSNIDVATSATNNFHSPSIPAISTNAWHYMVVTYDGASLCAFVDGQQQWCQALTGTLVLDPGNTIELGATPKGSSTGGIELDDAAYYTHSLSAARILAHYEAARAPSVSSVSPSSGSIAGGDTVTVSGYAFTGATAVNFGSTPAASFSVTNDTTISATSPAGAALGGVDVTVITPGGTSPTSSSDTFTYAQAATSTALPHSTANPSTYAQSVTFSTTVSGGGGTPSGTVTWKDGGTTLGTSSLDVSGSTSYSTSALATGTHLISAVYGGDTNHLGSTSTNLSQAVDTASSAVGTPTSSANPSVHGQSVTFSTTVTGPGGTPTGTVTWSDGPTVLGTSTLASGSASFSTSALATSSHSITAQYGGDGTYAPAGSAALTQTVGQASSSTSVLPAPNPATAGQTVTFSASVVAVAPGTGIATGTVTFYDGAASIGTGSLNAGGTATLSLAETGGSHNISAQYGGDADFTGSTSSVVVLTVQQAPSTVSAVASSLNPSTYGSPVTFTVTVSGGPTPTGTVTFYDGAIAMGTGTLDATGTATFSTSQLTAASHTISAVYGGDVNNSSGTSPALTQVVAQAAPAVATPLSSVNPSTFGGTVTFSTTLSGPGAVPTGTVTWMDGATVLGTSSVTPGGSATFAISTLGAGAHSITADYGGDVNYTAATSGVLTQNVNRASTSVSTPASTLNPADSGQTVTFSVNVTPAGATGAVTWMDGGTALGTTPVGGTGVASFSSAALAVGAHSITASYGGDANHLAATSAALVQTVNRVSSAITTPVSSLNPSVVGQAVTFNVSVIPPGSTGTVTWTDGATLLGATTVDGTGASSLTTSTLAVGSHSITAAYGGDSGHAPATSGTLVQAVDKITTAISTPVSSANPSTVGQPVTFSVSVTPVGSTGTVTWSDGAATLGTTAVDAAGTSSLSTSALAVGGHAVSAAYSGDANHLPATSGALAQTVSKLTSGISAPMSSSNPSIVGQPVTFSEAVFPPDATGTVTWMDGGVTMATTPLGSGGGASFTTSALSLGAHSISAAYGGDGTHLAATSGVLVQLVDRAVATISTPVSSLNPSLAAQAVTFTVSVSPVGATGTVTWMDGTTALGTSTLASGTATYTTSSLTIGSHSISAVYSGDATYLGVTSGVLVQVVSTLPATTPAPTATATPSASPGAGASPGTPPSTPSASPSPTPGPSAAPSSGGTPPGRGGGAPPSRPPTSPVPAVTAAPWWFSLATDIGVKSAFPLLLIILALLFLAVQDRIDRKDPKLALAPARPDPKLPFPTPRGTP